MNMRIMLSEKQLLKVVESQNIVNQDVSEQEAEVPSAEPTAGTSSTQSGGEGYPEVGKWESGVTRGPANQVGVTKWSDVVGANLKRGKSNPLK
jgi:hypothetical protein